MVDVSSLVEHARILTSTMGKQKNNIAIFSIQIQEPDTTRRAMRILYASPNGSIRVDNY